MFDLARAPCSISDCVALQTLTEVDVHTDIPLARSRTARAGAGAGWRGSKRATVHPHHPHLASGGRRAPHPAPAGCAAPAPLQTAPPQTPAAAMAGVGGQQATFNLGRRLAPLLPLQGSAAARQQLHPQPGVPASRHYCCHCRAAAAAAPTWGDASRQQAATSNSAATMGVLKSGPRRIWSYSSACRPAWPVGECTTGCRQTPHPADLHGRLGNAHAISV